METGTIASWYLKVGDSFSAGDALAKIETDKASIDFEAQDDGFIAKILVTEGAEDIAVGSPIMITVEDAGDVAAFENYVFSDAKATSSPADTPPPPPTVSKSVEAPAKEPSPAPVIASPVAGLPPPPPPSPPPATVVQVVSSSPIPATGGAPTAGPAWGSSARVKSPIAKTLISQQKAYIALYGATGQIPL